MTTQTTWKLRIVGHDRVAPDQLTANPYNHRRHPQKQRDALAAAIREVGFIRSVTVNQRTGNLIDGHERVWQALQAEVPLIDVEYVDLSEEDERKALAVLDKIGELAEVDPEALDALLREIETGEAELQALLAEMATSAGLYAGNGEVVEDEVPEPPAEPVTKPGDLWLLGEHRVLCGDSTNADDVARLLAGRVPFLMVTDPPYGVEYEPEWRNEAAAKGLIAFAARREGKVENDERVDWTESYGLFPGLVAYVWHDGKHTSQVAANLVDCEFEIRSQIIWRKPTFAISRGHYHWQHEPCLYAVRKGGSAKWCGDRSQSTVWDISNRVDRDDNSHHGTQKPVECMARPIRNHGGPDDDVYDPFLGSGTTLIAAEQLNRRCYGLELSPAYCDVIIERWERLTGGKATRA